MFHTRVRVSFGRCAATWKRRRTTCCGWWTSWSTRRRRWPRKRAASSGTRNGWPKRTGWRTVLRTGCRLSADCWPAPRWAWCTWRAPGSWARTSTDARSSYDKGPGLKGSFSFAGTDRPALVSVHSTFSRFAGFPTVRANRSERQTTTIVVVIIIVMFIGFFFFSR